MTNGIFKSPVLRVLTNVNKLRLSFALFSEPEAEKEIGPVDCLIDETRSRLYRNVRNFAAFNYECYQKGKGGTRGSSDLTDYLECMFFKV